MTAQLGVYKRKPASLAFNSGSAGAWMNPHKRVTEGPLWGPSERQLNYLSSLEIRVIATNVIWGSPIRTLSLTMSVYKD